MRKILTNYWLPVSFEGVQKELLQSSRHNYVENEVVGVSVLIRDKMVTQMPGKFVGFVTLDNKPIYGAFFPD